MERGSVPIPVLARVAVGCYGGGPKFQRGALLAD